jgi:DNA repair exonuclease SbcCD ATPase subunit
MCVLEEYRMETNLEQCPLCGSELSQTKFREIRTKLREQADGRATELAEARLAITKQVELEFKKQFEQDKRTAEKAYREKAEQVVKKATAEREELAKKLQEAEAREPEIRKQAQAELERQKQTLEKKAKADAEQQVKKLTTERDQAARKLKEAEEREAGTRKQVVQDAEKQRQKDLTEQRQALDRDKTAALFKQQSEFNRQRESFQKKIQIMENQLQRKTANELGDGGEIDVFEALRGAFDGKGGKTTRVPKGQSGADLLHEVFYKGESCGRIIIDAKNRQAWQNGFVTKLRQDQVPGRSMPSWPRLCFRQVRRICALNRR